VCFLGIDHFRALLARRTCKIFRHDDPLLVGKATKGQGKKKDPLFASPPRGTVSSPSQERRAGACRKNFDTGRIVENWLRCCPLPPRKAPFFLPLHQFLVRTGKARSSSRPCKAGLSERRSLSKRASWRGTGRFFAPIPWQKIPAPLLTGEDVEIRSRQDGAKPSSIKNFSPLGLSDSFLHRHAATTTGRLEVSIYRGLRPQSTVLERPQSTVPSAPNRPWISAGIHTVLWIRRGTRLAALAARGFLLHPRLLG
jgi:hypothetical protein